MPEENKISLVVEGDYSSAFKFWILRKKRLYQPITQTIIILKPETEEISVYEKFYQQNGEKILRFLFGYLLIIYIKVPDRKYIKVFL